MRLEHYPAEQLKKDLRHIISRHLDTNTYRVFFFGSRVTGRGSERSDIDIGIEGPAEVPGSAIEAIREEVEELPLLYMIDVVDMSKVSAGFRRVALEQTETVTS